MAPKREPYRAPMVSKRAWRYQAIRCALIFVCCVLIAKPFANIGVLDDWSYVKTATVLAATGRIVYNGWATAMLGWQLFPAAFLIKVFGGTYAPARMSTLAESGVTAFLLQRLFVRLGLREEVATFGTLVFCLSPIWMMLSVTFMSDVAGVAVIVASTYFCVRAIQAGSSRNSLLWLATAVVVSTVGGTARQIAWLTLLVMVPMAVWILRRVRLVVPVIGAMYLAGVATMFVCLRWYNNQPFSIPETLKSRLHGLKLVEAFFVSAWGVLFDTMFLALPVLLLLAWLAWRRNRQLAIATGSVCVLFFVALLVKPQLGSLLEHLPSIPPYIPYPHAMFNAWGLVAFVPPKGMREIVLSHSARAVLGTLVLASFSCFGLLFRSNRRGEVRHEGRPGLTWANTVILLVPFCLAYLALLGPRASSGAMYDRYLLPLVLFVIAFALKAYQDDISRRALLIGYGLVAVVGVFGIAVTHDLFALERGSLTAISELRAEGVPRTAIDGGWEYNFETQVEVYPSINDERSKTWSYIQPQPLREDVPDRCRRVAPDYSPAVTPVYRLSFQKDECGTETAFAPVKVGDWLGRRQQDVYIVRVLK